MEAAERAVCSTGVPFAVSLILRSEALTPWYSSAAGSNLIRCLAVRWSTECGGAIWLVIIFS